jgi:hypothetical protein
MEILVPPRPDHSPPEKLSDVELARAVTSLRRKLRSVRASLRAAWIALVAALSIAVAFGFIAAWVVPEPFLARMFGSGTVITIPELLAWWAAVIAAALLFGTATYRFFAHRLRAVRAWKHKSLDLERRFAHANAESVRRGVSS